MTNKLIMRGYFQARKLTKDRSGGAAVNAALLFGCIAVALTVLLTPFAERAGKRMAASGVFQGTIVTGAVKDVKRYRVRKSVLQNQNLDGCTIRSNGESEGDC